MATNPCSHEALQQKWASAIWRKEELRHVESQVAERVAFLWKTTQCPAVCAAHSGLLWYLIARNGFPNAMPVCPGSDDAAMAGRQLMLAHPCLSSYVPSPSTMSLTNLNSSADQGA